MKADVITKDFLKNPVVFADLFNLYIYGGESEIRPDELRECDTAKTALHYDTDGDTFTLQK